MELSEREREFCKDLAALMDAYGLHFTYEDSYSHEGGQETLSGSTTVIVGKGICLEWFEVEQAIKMIPQGYYAPKAILRTDGDIIGKP